jgi:hypothetical protein
MSVPKNLKLSTVADADTCITCPSCGGEHYESNHLDEGLYREAALHASDLIRQGEDDAALEAVIAYYTVRKFNDGQPSRRCLSCGAFDA